jgi:acyl-ACP thioesterase
VTLPPRPVAGRVFEAQRRVRLSDTDAAGRLRLDAVARYLQDVAADDVADAGWAADEHVWVVRRTLLDVPRPFLGDEEVDLATWCSGVGAAAAARRTSLVGDRGGAIEAESVWIHLDRELRPARLGQRFRSVYAPAAEGRGVSTRFSLAAPPADSTRAPWPLRATDVDLLGHVNNAAYWAAVEEVAVGRLREPLRAELEYRQPIDLGETVEIVSARCGGEVWLVVDSTVRAAAAVGQRGSIQTARARPTSSPLSAE